MLQCTTIIDNDGVVSVQRFSGTIYFRINESNCTSFCWRQVALRTLKFEVAQTLVKIDGCRLPFARKFVTSCVYAGFCTWTGGVIWLLLKLHFKSIKFKVARLHVKIYGTQNAQTFN